MSNHIQQVTDFRSNENDQVVYAAKKIGRSKHKKSVFKEVYFGKRKIKTVLGIAQKTRLSNKRVLEEGKKLVTAGLIRQTKHEGNTAYEPDPSYKGVWKKILNLAGNQRKIDKIPTKVSRPKTSLVKLTIPASQTKIKQITVDDITSFSKVKGTKCSKDFIKISETQFKKGLLKILGEKNPPPKDWGGEKNDIYTTSLKMGSQRYHAAFALKGPGQKVTKLTPKHMGKNGDQIQRLATSSVQVFMVQYWKEIDQSVVDQMQQFAIAKSYTENRTIHFGIIDGDDSSRLMKAYSRSCSSKGKI